MFAKLIVIYMLIFNSNFLLQVLIVLYIFFGIINVSWILVVVKYTLLGVLILVS